MPFRTEAAHHGALEPRPGSLHGVEVRRVGGEPHHGQPVVVLGEAAGREAAMRVDAVPQHDDGTWQVPMKELQEADDVGGPHGTIHQHQEEAGAPTLRRVRDRADGRQVLPAPEAVRQDRRLAPRRPGALDRRPLGEAALVEEDDVRTLARGVFFTAGQISCTQRSIASSSRSRARVVGF